MGRPNLFGKSMKAFLDDICAALRSALATWRTMRALRKGTNPDESF